MIQRVPYSPLRRLLDLRPVQFRYRKPLADGSQPIEYGLIAEEVAQAFPELVATGKDGVPESVKYHILPSLLLNELKRQQNEIAELKEAVRRLEAAR